MTEVPQFDRTVIERFFPHEGLSKKVEAFVGDILSIDGLEKVLAVNYTAKGMTFLYMLFENDVDSEWTQIHAALNKHLPDGGGWGRGRFVPEARSVSYFGDSLKRDEDLKSAEIGVVWEREKQAA